MFVCLLAWRQAYGQPAQTTDTKTSFPTVLYTITFADPAAHRLHVEFNPSFLDAANAVVQMPVWNALYQVRDFSQYIESLTATDAQHRPVTIRQLDKCTWSMPGAAHVEYDIVADVPGPYSAQFNSDHAFLNLAQILMYSVPGRNVSSLVVFKNVPAGWRIATVLSPDRDNSMQFSAPNYDALADAPVEAGRFREISFEDHGARYRVAIDADPDRYDASWIQDSVRRIVSTEVDWMQDRPCSEYLFIYHLPIATGGGGMEHACSAAIDVSARRLATDPTSFQSVTAHEFFHLWNVKRIRPQSLQPVDYTQEQYTRALWFSEGVTSTVEDYMLLRAGMVDQAAYLRRLGYEITALQERPAHLTQSAEDSSLNAWLEKYTFYRRPDRSISYYNKGEILGVLLDLSIRDATGGAKSLRDLMRWMNANYAANQRYFADSEGVRLAVETITGKDFTTFFHDYVAGLQEIPYDQFLRTAGFRMVPQREDVPDPGCTVSRDFDGVPIVVSVQSGSDAERAGLKAGDTIVAANGRTNTDPSDEIQTMKPGEPLRLRVRSAGSPVEHELEYRLGRRTEVQYVVRDVDHPTPAQLRRRTEWLKMPQQNIAGSTRP